MRHTVRMAVEAGVSIGAHPGFPDLAGFGRREMSIEPRDITDLVLNERSFNGANRWKQLHDQIAGLVGDGSLAASAEVELDCDYGLKYEYVIEAITAVSGSTTPDGQLVKLVEKIKFAPPRAE